jgi:hypothetical protein
VINWQIHGAQFGALWHDTGLDRYPFPFHIVSGFSWQSDLDKFEADVVAAFAGEEHERLRAAVRVLANPEVHVAVTGRTVADEPIRLIAAQVQQTVAIASQLPGPGPLHGGDVVLALGRAGQLAAQIVGSLPANAAGKQHFHATRAERDAEQAYSGGFLTQRASATQPRLEAVLTTHHAGNGGIRVWSGPRYGRENLIGSFRWIDVAADGRYVIGPYDRTQARPASPEAMTRVLDGLLTTAREEGRDPR